MKILAPCAGRVMPMTSVDDPVFSEQTVGPGVGISPDRGPAHVVAPADGLLLKLDPHAFILLIKGGVGILVHVGINTIRLGGEGFRLVAEQGAQVLAGTPIVSWNPDEASGPEISNTVVVAVMDHAPDSINSPAVGSHVSAGDPLFDV